MLFEDGGLQLFVFTVLLELRLQERWRDLKK